MASAQTYRDEINALVSGNSEMNAGSLADAKRIKGRMRFLAKQLLRIRRDLKSEIHAVWTEYKKASGNLGEDSFLDGLLWGRRKQAVRNQKRSRLAKFRDDKIALYQEVESVINDLLRQIDANENKLQILIDQFNAEAWSEKQAQEAERKRYENRKRIIAEENAKKQKRVETRQRKSGRSKQYEEYIESKEWRLKAEEAKARAGNRCQVCNRSRAEVQLDAHHRTYERLGNEKPEDITVLCRDCHQLYEDEKKSRRQCKRCQKSFVPPKPSHFYCVECFPIIKEQKSSKSQKNEAKKSTKVKGVCIRCQKETKLNPQAPYCYTCFKSWSKYQNKEYEEKFCHICGEENNSSLLKPVCINCYIKYKDELAFQ